MCRLMGYVGERVLVHDMLYRFKNSLVIQSKHACESEFVVNGDGFGLGWYDLDLDPEPGVFRSVQPAWNNSNLQYLSKKLKVSSFVAHIRAATMGVVSQANCHPFHYDRWLFAHNGHIENFKSLRRLWQSALDEPFYEFITGQTDSQNIFAMWLQKLLTDRKDPTAPLTLVDYTDAMRKMLKQLQWLERAYGEPFSVRINCVITDGTQMFGMRYSNKLSEPPPSLYWTEGRIRSEANEVYVNADEPKRCVLIASEKMDALSHWHEVQENHVVLVNADLSVHTEPVGHEFLS